MLAAGESARLRKPKQALPYKGKTLLEHSLQAAIDTGLDQIIVVLGANADQFLSVIEEKAPAVFINPAWKEGMSSSIRSGLQELLETVPQLEAVIIMVCDQPFVTGSSLNELILKYKETAKPIIASRYKNVAGTPALFDKTIFGSLLALKGDKGAKGIIKGNPHWVDIVDFPMGDVDIDTDSDYSALLQL